MRARRLRPNAVAAAAPNSSSIGGAGTSWPPVVDEELLVELDEDVEDEVELDEETLPEVDEELLVEVDELTLPEVEVDEETLPEDDEEVDE